METQEKKTDTLAEIKAKLAELVDPINNWRYIDDDYVDALKKLIRYIHDITA